MKHKYKDIVHKRNNIHHKSKRNYFADLDNRILKDNRKFRKTANPLFSERHIKKSPLQ